MKTYSLPMIESGTNQVVQLHCGQSVVIVGANGAGKSRLGSRIEDALHGVSHNSVQRIAAQKNLMLPARSVPTNKIEAEIRLREQFPVIHMANNYELLMTYLFTDEYEEISSFRKFLRKGNTAHNPPDTKLDTLKAIWEHILPHRELVIETNTIATKLKGSQQSTYNGSEMSDGERVVFYLIGQALAAPKDGTIIIDEPELHLHKSIQAKLWREIQNARPDCLFVYLTHDVEFAASLTEAKKIWLKSFNGQVWEWEEVPEVEGFPEELLLQVLGTRRPILFVEGDNGSLDVALFRFLYPDHTVIPRASCHEVIQSVTTLRALPQLLRFRIHGIIDRDRRTETEIASLKSRGVETLSVAEVENLFCLPEVLRIVAQKMNLPIDETVTKAQEFVFHCLQSELENQISLRVVNEVQFRLNDFNGKTKGQTNIGQEVARVAQRVDVPALYADATAQFRTVIDEQDYLGVLRLYNRKSLANRMSETFYIAQNKLPNHVLGLTQGEKAKDLRQAFLSHLPPLKEATP